MRQIRGILFDAGDTLVRPKAGEWFPRQHFVDAFRAQGITHANMDRFREALDAGLRYLNKHHALAVTEDIEREQFHTAYELILRALGISNPTEDLVADILRPFEEDVGMEPFPDTVRVLRRLKSAGFRMGVVSDNWPSLGRRFHTMGLRSYFDAFVISALVGSSKPCESIYRVAVEEIGIPPEHLAFVDDRPVNAATAERIGMKGIVISRYGEVPDTDLPVIPDLDGLIAIVIPETARSPSSRGTQDPR
ncbi:MAG: HAD-IA family hydrolase [Acidobacteria bacterium]|nr:HAD-IA family hydrolase [Acidobacteriota bacterium]